MRHQLCKADEDYLRHCKRINLVGDELVKVYAKENRPYAEAELLKLLPGFTTAEVWEALSEQWSAVKQKDGMWVWTPSMSPAVVMSSDFSDYCDINALCNLSVRCEDLRQGWGDREWNVAEILSHFGGDLDGTWAALAWLMDDGFFDESA
jgi:hypothetical protein